MFASIHSSYYLFLNVLLNLLFVFGFCRRNIKFIVILVKSWGITKYKTISQYLCRFFYNFLQLLSIWKYLKVVNNNYSQIHTVFSQRYIYLPTVNKYKIFNFIYNPHTELNRNNLYFTSSLDYGFYCIKMSKCLQCFISLYTYLFITLYLYNKAVFLYWYVTRHTYTSTYVNKSECTFTWTEALSELKWACRKPSLSTATVCSISDRLDWAIF